MSIDITLYSELDEAALLSALQKRFLDTPFAAYADWQKVYSPGPFDQEIISDFGHHFTVRAKAGFRIRKDTREAELSFLKELEKNFEVQASVVFLMNGEPWV